MCADVHTITVQQGPKSALKLFVEDRLNIPFTKCLFGKSSWRAAGATFLAFLVAGSVPLFPFFLPIKLAGWTIFLCSTAATMVAFYLIGVAKGRVLGRSQLWSGLETLAVGGAAAFLAYGVGALLHAVLGQ